MVTGEPPVLHAPLLSKPLFIIAAGRLRGGRKVCVEKSLSVVRLIQATGCWDSSVELKSHKTGQLLEKTLCEEKDAFE